MSMTTVGTLSFLVQPAHGKEFDLAVYVNHSSDAKIIEFSCRYSPLPGEAYDYFISSTYRLSETERTEGQAGVYQLSNAVMLRGTIKDGCATNVMRRVSNDIERVTALLNRIKEMLRKDPKGFKDALGWHVRSLQRDKAEMNVALRSRDFIVAIEILALSLLAIRHPDPDVGDLGNQVLDAIFPDEQTNKVS